MPYIKQRDREILDAGMRMPDTAGELNYMITMLLLRYLVKKGVCYQTCNDIVGALDNAKSEFKRRVQDPYEDTKIKENGEVYYGIH
jgi:hypothetical protein